MDGLASCELFVGNVTTLEETSRGGSGSMPMTTSHEPAINMDLVMKEYVAGLPEEDGRPASVDALIRYESDSPVLVEFKSGKNISKDEIRNKLTSTLLMIDDVTGLTPSTYRRYFSYILVYDKNNFSGGGNAIPDSRRYVQPSDSREYIKKRVRQLSNTSVLPKQLRGIDTGLKGVFIRQVVILDKDEFNKYVNSSNAG